MITKKEYCEHIISEFQKEKENVTENDILQSSSLAVAMEYLGLIQDRELLEYATSRDGIFILTNKGKVLSTRELLNLLPDEDDN